MQTYFLSTFLKAGTTESILVPNCIFRINRIKTQAAEQGLILINGFYINDSKESELIGTIDGYSYSIKLEQELINDFYKEHNLIGKSTEEVDDYLYENDLSLPEVGRIHLPTMNKGDRIKITGEFKVDCPLTFIGIAP